MTTQAERLDVSTSDGRVLETRVAGPADGMPLVFHHGTPGAGLHHPVFTDAATERGLRMVMYSRPGYASSTPHPGRLVADAAADTASILDGIGADRFVTVGWSGGGPHALACSALLGERCAGAATIAGVAPFQADGLEWFRGMAPENVEEYSAAADGVEPITVFLDAFAGQLATIQGPDVAESLGGLISDVDREQLTGDFADYLAETMREGSANGIAGWRDDDLAFVRDWGFALAEIGHVAVWQGSEDRMVPFAHGKWLADALPDVDVHLHEGEGHLSIAKGRFGTILDSLRL